MTIACYPGSFDPVTNGHLDVVERGLAMFDAVILAVAENPVKKGLFSVDERMEMLREVTAHLERVKVTSFIGLTVDLCRREGADVILRGLRAVSDFDFEMQMAQMNSRMGVETCFLAASPTWSYLSSSLMKEVVRYGGSIDGLVPDEVVRRLAERLSEGKS